MALDSDVAALVARGVAIIVATRDDELRPEITRGWGPQLAADRATLTICLGLSPGSKTRANLESNGAMAATFSQPTTYRTVQIKGVARALSDPPPAERERVDEHLAAFLAEAAQIGVPREAAHLLEPELLAVP